jgi:hypothetical protein
MLNSSPLQELAAGGCPYLTAMTKPQSAALIQQGGVQGTWVDAPRREGVPEEVRYSLPRNNLQRLPALRAERPTSLATPSRAQPAPAGRTVQRQAQRLGVATGTAGTTPERHVGLPVQEADDRQATRLEGVLSCKRSWPRRWPLPPAAPRGIKNWRRLRGRSAPCKLPAWQGGGFSSARRRGRRHTCCASGWPTCGPRNGGVVGQPGRSR